VHVRGEKYTTPMHWIWWNNTLYSARVVGARTLISCLYSVYVTLIMKLFLNICKGISVELCTS